MQNAMEIKPVESSGSLGEYEEQLKNWEETCLDRIKAKQKKKKFSSETEQNYQRIIQTVAEKIREQLQRLKLFDLYLLFPSKFTDEIFAQLRGRKMSSKSIRDLKIQVNNVIVDLANEVYIFAETLYIPPKSQREIIEDVSLVDGSLVDALPLLLKEFYTNHPDKELVPVGGKENGFNMVQELICCSIFSLIIHSGLAAPNTLDSIRTLLYGEVDPQLQIIKILSATERYIKKYPFDLSSSKYPVFVDPLSLCFLLSLLLFRKKEQNMSISPRTPFLPKEYLEGAKNLSELFSSWLKHLSDEAGLKHPMTTRQLLLIAPLYSANRFPPMAYGPLQGRPYHPMPNDQLKRLQSGKPFLIPPSGKIVKEKNEQKPAPKIRPKLPPQQAQARVLQSSQVSLQVRKILGRWQKKQLSRDQTIQHLRSLTGTVPLYSDYNSLEGEQRTLHNLRVIIDYFLNLLERRGREKIRRKTFPTKISTLFSLLTDTLSSCAVLSLNSSEEVATVIAEEIFIYGISEKEWMESTAKKNLYALLDFFGFVHDTYKNEDGVPFVPLPDPELPELKCLRTTIKVVPIIGEKELDTILKSISENSDLSPWRRKTYRVAIILLFFIGPRIHELVAIRMKDVQVYGEPFIYIRPETSRTKLAGGYCLLKMLIPDEDPKRYRSEVITFWQERYNKLKQLVQGHIPNLNVPFLCDDHGQPFTVDAIFSALKKQFARAGYPHVTPHTLRHSFISFLLLRWYCANHPTCRYTHLFHHYDQNYLFRRFTHNDLSTLTRHVSFRVPLMVYSQTLGEIQRLYMEDSKPTEDYPSLVETSFASMLLGYSSRHTREIFKDKIDGGKIPLKHLLGELCTQF